MTFRAVNSSEYCHCCDQIQVFGFFVVSRIGSCAAGCNLCCCTITCRNEKCATLWDLAVRCGMTNREDCFGSGRIATVSFTFYLSFPDRWANLVVGYASIHKLSRRSQGLPMHSRSNHMLCFRVPNGLDWERLMLCLRMQSSSPLSPHTHCRAHPRSGFAHRLLRSTGCGDR